jgi:hypothetical protein
MPRQKSPKPDSSPTVASVAVAKREEITVAATNLLNRARDSAGFLVGDQPSITSDQITWLTYRMGVDNDDEATQLSGLDTALVQSWLADNDFLAVYDVAIRNKREAFKLIGSQLLPKAIRTISMLLDKALEEGNMRGAQIGLNMLLRSQGLLIDKISTDSGDKVDALMEMLRETAPIQVLNMEPR